MKICPFLKLLRSEVSNRPRIFRCWINDPYTFQNRCTSWQEAISNFGNFLNTGILLVDAIGLQRSFPETFRACDPLPCFSILHKWITNPQHETRTSPKGLPPKIQVLKIHVPHLLPWSFLQHLQVCFFKGIRIHWKSPFKRLLQLWPNYSWLHWMEDHGTHCVSTVEVDVKQSKIMINDHQE